MDNIDNSIEEEIENLGIKHDLDKEYYNVMGCLFFKQELCNLV